MIFARCCKMHCNVNSMNCNVTDVGCQYSNHCSVQLAASEIYNTTDHIVFSSFVVTLHGTVIVPFLDAKIKY